MNKKFCGSNLIYFQSQYLIEVFEVPKYKNDYKFFVDRSLNIFQRETSDNKCIGFFDG